MKIFDMFLLAYAVINWAIPAVIMLCFFCFLIWVVLKKD